jgi:hypothetical protein
VATYDPRTSEISRLEAMNMPSRGFSSHGMDVVPSSSNPNELFLYLINHRTPVDGRDARVVGADSSIEVFKTVVGSHKMVHHATFEDPLIMTPNDIVGSPDGKSFHITNDHGTKTGAVSNGIMCHCSFFHVSNRPEYFTNTFDQQRLLYTAMLIKDANTRRQKCFQITVLQERGMIPSM